MGLPAESAAKQLLHDGDLGEQLLVPLGLLARLVERALQRAEIGEHQLGVDGGDVPQRVDAAVDVDHVRRLEAAHHVEDGVDLADVAEELVAQALARARAAHQAGDVDDAHGGREDLLALDEPRELAEPGVGHGDDADVGLDGAERVVLRLRLGGGEGVEQGALADVGQADDSDFEAHGGRASSTGRRAKRADAGATRGAGAVPASMSEASGYMRESSAPTAPAGWRPGSPARLGVRPPDRAPARAPLRAGSRPPPGG